MFTPGTMAQAVTHLARILKVPGSSFGQATLSSLRRQSIFMSCHAISIRMQTNIFQIWLWYFALNSRFSWWLRNVVTLRMSNFFTPPQTSTLQYGGVHNFTHSFRDNCIIICWNRPLALLVVFLSSPLRTGWQSPDDKKYLPVTQGRCVTWPTVLFNPLNTKRRPLYLKTQFVPRSKHFILVIKTNQLALCRPNVAACSLINTKHINTVWAERIIFEC